MVAAAPEADNDRPASLDVIAELRAGLAETRGEIRAAAVVADVRLVSAGGDAIQVEVEHAQGTALTVLLPYNKKRFGRGVEFGDLRLSAGTRKVWLD